VILVVLKYPNGQTQEVLLAGVPRKGEQVRTNGNVDAPSLDVEHVLWMQGRRGSNAPDPIVIVSVRPHAEGPS
jgi:hypothetical protein